MTPAEPPAGPGDWLHSSSVSAPIIPRPCANGQTTTTAVCPLQSIPDPWTLSATCQVHYHRRPTKCKNSGKPTSGMNYLSIRRIPRYTLYGVSITMRPSGLPVYFPAIFFLLLHPRATMCVCGTRARVWTYVSRLRMHLNVQQATCSSVTISDFGDFGDFSGIYEEESSVLYDEYYSMKGEVGSYSLYVFDDAWYLLPDDGGYPKFRVSVWQ